MMQIASCEHALSRTKSQILGETVYSCWTLQFSANFLSVTLNGCGIYRTAYGGHYQQSIYIPSKFSKRFAVHTGPGPAAV